LAQGKDALEGFKRPERQSSSVSVRIKKTPAPGESEETEAENLPEPTPAGPDQGAIMQDRPAKLVGIVGSYAMSFDTLQRRAEAQMQPGIEDSVPEEDFEAMLRRAEDELLSEWAYNTLLSKVAKEGGLSVTREDMRMRLIELADAAGKPGDPEAALKVWGIDIEDYVKELELAVLTEKLVYKTMDESLTDEEWRKLYERAKRDFRVSEAVKLRAIVKDLSSARNDEDLVAMIEGMRTAARRVKKGEPFDRVAREVSDAKLSGDKGGDMGWVATTNQLGQPWNSKIFTLTVGRPTDVVQSDDGRFLYIFLVEQKRPASLRPFEEVRPELRMLLYDEVRENLYNHYRSKERVLLNAGGIDPKRLEKIDLSQVTIF